MAEQVSQGREKRPLRSIKDDRFAMVTFICRTKRRADVFWLDYQGGRVKYATLEHGQPFPILTFETHPWVFRDADTGSVLVANNKDEVYFPVQWTGEGQTLVFIDIPGMYCHDCTLNLIINCM